MTASQPDPSALEPGTMAGEYRIEGVLGQGGMGTVYAARHPLIAKRAAVKVLHPSLSADEAAVQRFIQEARSVNQIGHPNIVDIFAFGTLPDGRNYFVMEWLRGESVRDRMKRERIPLVEALSVLETVTLPLEATHEAGIVHRDLKPDNIFLVDVKGARPQVTLLDFGIAKLMGAGSLLQTQTGHMLGTPAYISPEQLRGDGVDHRTDIYALGAMAFEVLTGRYAFEATNAAEMISKHLFEPPRAPSSVEPSIPPALDRLIVRMLAKDATARPSLSEIRHELRAIRHSMGGLLTPPAGVATVAKPSSPLLSSTPPQLARTVAASTVHASGTRPRSRALIGALLGSTVAIAAVLALTLASRNGQPTARSEVATTNVPEVTAVAAGSGSTSSATAGAGSNSGSAAHPVTAATPDASVADAQAAEVLSQEDVEPAPKHAAIDKHGVLVVEILPVHARVRVDKQALVVRGGRVRLQTAAGRHEVTVEAPDMVPHRESVKVERGETTRVKVILEPKPRWKPQPVGVDVLGNPTK